MFKKVKIKKTNDQNETFKEIVNEYSKKPIFEKDFKVSNSKKEFIKLFDDSFEEMNKLAFGWSL